MEALNNLLTDQMGPMGPLMAAGFLGVLMVLITLPFLLKKNADPLDKLKKSANASKVTDHKEALRAKQRNDKLAKYSQFLEPKTEEELEGIKLKLMQAGYRDRDAVRYFHFAQFALGIGFLILGVIYYLVFKSGAETTNTKQMLMYILGPGAAGYMLPKYWVERRRGARQEEITNGFPDSLDMMLVCVEAGQSMDQAIIRVSGEIRASYPSLADEFEIVSHEMKAGKDKTAVLNDMAERAGVQDVASFVTVLNQSQAFGTPISDALRVYAGEMRDKRVMRAEEAANKLPTKMTLATMMLTVPPLLVILVGPSMHGISQLGNMGTH